MKYSTQPKLIVRLLLLSEVVRSSPSVPVFISILKQVLKSSWKDKMLCFGRWIILWSKKIPFIHTDICFLVFTCSKLKASDDLQRVQIKQICLFIRYYHHLLRCWSEADFNFAYYQTINKCFVISVTSSLELFKQCEMSGFDTPQWKDVVAMNECAVSETHWIWCTLHIGLFHWRLI